MIAGAGTLSKLSTNSCVPTAALCLVGMVPAAIVLVGLIVQDALNTIVSFAVAGIYIAFQMVVAAALYARLRGWRPSGEFKLGRWEWPVTLCALLYRLLAIGDILWPRTPHAPRYVNYSTSLGVAAALVSAAIYMIVGRPYARGTAANGDAWSSTASSLPRIMYSQDSL